MRAVACETLGDPTKPLGAGVLTLRAEEPAPALPSEDHLRIRCAPNRRSAGRRGPRRGAPAGGPTPGRRALRPAAPAAWPRSLAGARPLTEPRPRRPLGARPPIAAACWRRRSTTRTRCKCRAPTRCAGGGSRAAVGGRCIRRKKKQRKQRKTKRSAPQPPNAPAPWPCPLHALPAMPAPEAGAPGPPPRTRAGRRWRVPHWWHSRARPLPRRAPSPAATQRSGRRTSPSCPSSWAKRRPAS
jgi:hypothetical protein